MKLRLVIYALVLLQGRRARAQAPQITAVWPPGGTMGSKVSARIEGENLGGATAVFIGGRGVSLKPGESKDPKILPINLDIASDAAPGPHEVRIVTPKGVSNPGYVWVGVLPETPEAEPDNQPEQAMKLNALPVTVYGRSDAPEDVDWYSFDAGAGETFVFEMCANRIYSPIDAFMELHDAQGHLLATGTEGYDRDPRIIYTFKTAGTYRLQVRDTLYRGGTGYVYRVSIGKIPMITSMTPSGGRRGQRLEAAVTGVNLGGMTSFAVDIPAATSGVQPLYVSPQTPAGPALPILIPGDDYPQSVKGGFASSTQPMAVQSLPITINARLDAAKQADNYTIQGSQGKGIPISIRARTIGSRLDPYIRIFDKDGKEILNTEDQIGRDPRITFNPPATENYRLEVTSLDGKGGPDYFYRISFGTPQITALRITASPDVISLSRGQTIAVTINVTRFGDLGEVAVRVDGLPPGVTASPLVIPKNQSSGTLTLTEAPDAVTGAAAIRIVGESLAGGQKLASIAVAIASLPRPGEGQPAPRTVEFQGVATTEAVPLFSLSLEPSEVSLAPGDTAMVKVKVARKPGDNAANPAVALALANLPPGVTAETPAIPEKQSEITIKLTASKDAPPSAQSALLTGKLGDNSQPAPALVISVKPK